MARVDDFTVMRVAQYPVGATSTQSPLENMLRGLDGMWDSTSAVQFENTDIETTGGRTGFHNRSYLLDTTWKGIGSPAPVRTYNTTAGSQGEYRTTDRYNGKMITVPLAESNNNKAEKDKLRGLMWPSVALVNNLEMPKKLAAGFRNPTRANSRYLLDISDEGSFELANRTEAPDAISPLKLKSTWGWYVTPRTAGDGVAFTPAGDGPDLIWGVYWPGTINQTMTISVTIGTTTTTSNFAGIPSLGSPFFCFSPPFREIADDRFPSSRIRPYLPKGVPITINIAPNGGTIFYFENYGSP